VSESLAAGAASSSSLELGEVSGKIRPHSFDSMLDTDVLHIIGPHTKESPPNPHLSVYLIVCDVRQICGEIG
jgi:hypothetical protein